MKTRTDKTRTENITGAQFEDAMAKYAAAEKREAEINRYIETEVNEVLEKYSDELMCLAQGKTMAFDVVHAYCRANKQALFARRRSIATLHGVAGFRLGTPRHKTASGNNWEKVLGELKERLPDYVRASEEPAKDLLLADRHKVQVAPVLRDIGVEVVQEEVFYIEAKQAA